MKKLLTVLFAMTFLAIGTPAFSQKCRPNFGGNHHYSRPSFGYGSGYGYGYGNGWYGQGGFRINICPRPIIVQPQPVCVQPVVIQSSPAVVTTTITTTTEIQGNQIVTTTTKREPYETMCKDIYGRIVQCTQYKETITREYKTIQ